jgi:hypothetical protein
MLADEGEMMEGEDEEMDEKQSFMKGIRPKPKGKSLTIIGVTAAKKPKGKGKMYG